MIKHINIRIVGLVQGVFFRRESKMKAEELDIRGFVRNEPNSSVYIEAEGEEENLEKFLDWCCRGPRLAKVQDLEVSESEIKNFSDFLMIGK